MIATVEVSGAANAALLMALWKIFVDDLAGMPWDEMTGFGVTLSR
jgi:hypothetical protein